MIDSLNKQRLKLYFVLEFYIIWKRNYLKRTGKIINKSNQLTFGKKIGILFYVYYLDSRRNLEYNLKLSKKLPFLIEVVISNKTKLRNNYFILFIFWIKD